jgi:zinc protease
MFLLGLIASLAGAPLTVPHEKLTLENGLTVILHEDHSVPRVHVSVRYRVGSSREQPGRTGFAHLFEHLMFEGSQHVPEGAFDRWLEAAGGENNAYTSEDETYYFEEVPAHAAELALFLESDRMGFFVDALGADLVDGQRDVVKNERRQTVENRPWGAEEDLLPPALWPKGHPYSWSVIGSMTDLSAASLDDVKTFFRTWYAPANAILVLVGDFDSKQMKDRVRHWFSDVPKRQAPPRPMPAPATLTGERRVIAEDARASLAKLTITWPTVPVFHEDDALLDVTADVLGGAASARLTRRLVHELQIAQSVSVSQQSMERAGAFSVEVIAMPDVPLQRIVTVIDEEIAHLARSGPEPAEVARTQAKMETAFADALDGLGSKAMRLSAYEAVLGTPDAFERDLSRYRAAKPEGVRDVVRRRLGRGRVVMSLVPMGRVDQAARNASGGAR